MEKLASIDSLIERASKSFDTGDFRASASSYSRAISLCKNEKSKSCALRLARAYNGLGHTLRSQGKFADSKRYQILALERYRAIAKYNQKVLPELAVSLHYMGDILADYKKMREALKFYTEEFKIAKSLYSRKNSKGLALMVYGLNGMACRYADLKNTGRALRLLNQSVRYLNKNAKGRGNKLYPNLSWTYHIIGTTMLKSGDANGAVKNLKLAAKMRKVIAKDNKRFIAALKNTLNKLGDAYVAVGNTKEADRYFRETIRIVSSATYKKQVTAQVSSRELRQLKQKISHMQ
ncbi:MAG: tetratricopeptide repeat protein [Candidatus Micrarchaeota archaeon]|nr:tetratricopeptide repeat protein [Candidatus Micrarchaeota archaeon]